MSSMQTHTITPFRTHTMSRLAIPFLLLSVLALAACSEAPAPAPEAPTPIMQGNQLRFPAGHPQLALLSVATAAPSKTIMVELPARLVWNEERTQRIYPAFAGRVTSIKADVGQAVQPGAVLAQLASPDFGVAQADTTKARIDAGLAQKAVARQRELFDAGIVARKDLEQAEADSARAQAEVTRASARTQMYGGGASFNQTLALTAGVRGLVVERNLNPGQELRPDQSGPGVPPLFVVSDPSSLWVQIDARESEVGTLRPGATFHLTVPALPDQKFEGHVVAAADFIDPTSRTIKIRGVVDNTQRLLKAEMLATARFERQLGAGVVIPASAVLLRGNQHLVYVQAQPGMFEPREVVISYQGSKDVVISRGLEVGEQVVSENTLLLARQFRFIDDDAKPAAKATPPSTAPAATAAPATETAAK